jgi:hypothetical protein
VRIILDTAILESDHILPLFNEMFYELARVLRYPSAVLKLGVA